VVSRRKRVVQEGLGRLDGALSFCVEPGSSGQRNAGCWWATEGGVAQKAKGAQISARL
jgi:hypothetical protein